jgi:hypothetical protein
LGGGQADEGDYWFDMELPAERYGGKLDMG